MKERRIGGIDEERKKEKKKELNKRKDEVKIKQYQK